MLSSEEQARVAEIEARVNVLARCQVGCAAGYAKVGQVGAKYVVEYRQLTDETDFGKRSELADEVREKLCDSLVFAPDDMRWLTALVRRLTDGQAGDGDVP